MSAPPTSPQRSRLAGETSPYLLQHASNPVDWYPWGPEALERARREQRPILLSIGYAACHWCHVMERESFEDAQVAALMNAHFVCIKVDREERPDLDEIYMSATIAMSGGGGWPMTVFLTPDQQPFFAGTYFPPRDSQGRPGFTTLLKAIARAWEHDRDAVGEQARELTEHIRAQALVGTPTGLGDAAIEAAVAQLTASFDERWGGFGAAPKFPPCAALSLLLRVHARTGHERALTMVRRTLDAMKDGALYDQLAGGFARYATDERWRVPHFEKMLYDNAQLVRVYVEAWQLTGEPEYERVARETCDYVLRELSLPDGGFASAEDADSEGVEGRAYVWTLAELRAALGPEDARLAAAYFGATEQGTWEGTNPLFRAQPIEALAQQEGLAVELLTERLQALRGKLLEARAARPAPLRDDKLITAWNALMLGALAEAGRAFGERRYVDAAASCASHLLTRLRRPDGGLWRTARGGRAHLEAYLEDYAFLTDALVDLWEAAGDASHLDAATKLAERLLEDFGDPASGALFHTAHRHEQLLARLREGHDGAVPSGNAVAARALARLAVQLGRPALRQRAIELVRAWGRSFERAPRAFCTLLSTVDFLLSGPVELVVVGSREGALARALGRKYLPNRVLAIVDGPEDSRPLTAGKRRVQGAEALYVCRDYTCAAPITEPGALDAALAALPAAPRSGGGLGDARLRGHASAQGTAALAARQLQGRPRAYTQLGRTGWLVSRVGFGGYRVDTRSAAHREALRHALRAGVNLLDTSSNYAEGDSERLIGEVLAELCTSDEVAREGVVVITKLGTVQGDALKLARERAASGRPFPEMVELEEDAWHCLHPEWLHDELGRSLERLGLETVDLCLLHNPEHFFAQPSEQPLEQQRAELVRRLTAAFTALEAEVARGRIAAYGVSSNTLAHPRGAERAIDASELLSAAERAGGPGHHLRVVQLPLNLLEPGATQVLTPEGQSVLEAAQARGLGVIVNRPLNVVEPGGLLRLVTPPLPSGADEVDSALLALAALEDEYRRELAPAVELAPGAPAADKLLIWATQLGQIAPRVTSLEQWRELEQRFIGPRLGHAFGTLDRAFDQGALAERWRALRARYLTSFEALVRALRARAATRSGERAAALLLGAAPTLPEAWRALPLEQVALGTLLATPGVDVVLVGMRQPAYVDSALAALELAPPSDAQRVYQAIARARAALG